MGTAEYLRENAIHFNDHKSLIKACIEATGKSYKNVYQAYYDMQRRSNPIIFPAEQMEENVIVRSVIGISESELRKKHDTKYIIGQEVAKLEKGIYLMDADFINRCSLRSQIGYRQFLDDADFAKYKGKAGGIIYWSHPDSIAKMKSEGILR